MKPVYLDNNATTRVDPAVVSAMLPFFTEQFGNASSMHAFGSDVSGAIKQARKSIQALIAPSMITRSSSPPAGRRATIPPSSRRSRPCPGATR